MLWYIYNYKSQCCLITEFSSFPHINSLEMIDSKILRYLDHRLNTKIGT